MPVSPDELVLNAQLINSSNITVMTKIIFVVVAGFLTVGISTTYTQENLASNGAIFAVVPPATAAALVVKTDSPAATGILNQAAKELKASPHPLPHIHTEGTLPHHGIYDESEAAVADFQIARNLAIAYRLTKDTHYLDAVNNYLVAWSSVYQISLNPIDETRLDQFIAAYDLVKEAVPDSTRQKMTILLRQMAEGYAGAVVEKKKDAGNWQSHRVKLLTLSAFALGDDELIHKAHEAFSEHVTSNIQPDGSVHDFHERDAIHYVTYDLEPLTMTCLAAKMHDQDWFNEGTTSSVAKAIDWLVPFATGEKTHVEFVHSTVQFDRDRANAGIGAYIPHQWEPDGSIVLLTMVAAVDPARRKVCEQVAANARLAPSDWVALLFWPAN